MNPGQKLGKNFLGKIEHDSRKRLFWPNRDMESSPAGLRRRVEGTCGKEKISGGAAGDKQLIHSANGTHGTAPEGCLSHCERQKKRPAGEGRAINHAELGSTCGFWREELRRCPKCGPRQAQFSRYPYGESPTPPKAGNAQRSTFNV